MSIAVLVMTDGRDQYLDRAVASAAESLGDVAEWWMHDDTGDDSYRAELRSRHPGVRHIDGGPVRRGFGGAIRSAWEQLGRASAADFVFHLEADFIFRRPVDLDAMADVLDSHPYLAQMALRRQPWNATEAAAGGIVETHPDAYTEVRDGGHVWLEHRRFFTTNPCLYRRQLCSARWPRGAESEGRFGLGLLKHGLPWGIPGDQVRFAFWGAWDSGEWVEHIGHQRAGTGY